MSDLPSQYAEEVETFRQILDLPDPGETLPRFSTTVPRPGRRERPTGAKAKKPFCYAPFKPNSQRCF